MEKFEKQSEQGVLKVFVRSKSAFLVVEKPVLQHTFVIFFDPSFRNNFIGLIDNAFRITEPFSIEQMVFMILSHDSLYFDVVSIQSVVSAQID